MKELSIEQKVQRYDEALKRAKIWKDKSGMPKDKQGILDDIFPELKESEDERIRKEILEYFQQFENEELRGVNISDLIAWLEKQGEPTDINPSEFDLRLNKLLKQFKTLPKEELASSLSFYLNVVQNDGTYKEEKQGEQKSSDEVEPKFKVGDWIVDNANYIWKIEGILNQFYILEGVEGGESCPTIEWTDNTFHLWTIQDAMDGEVLQLGKVTAIFQEYIGNGNCSCYCSVCNGEFEIPSQNDADNSYGCYDATPATKEQRDFLFKSMKDDGYEWDTEKKELKKICTFCQENCKGFQETGRCFSDGECKAKKEYIEQKHNEWSEEDEEFLRRAIKATKDVYPVTADWLKSLKDRVQPKQEWSEEDEKMFSELSSSLLINISDQWVKYGKWLKSLKGRITWKPTVEQLASLTIACDRNDKIGFDLTQLLEELKKL